MHSVCKEKIENINLLADGMLDVKEAEFLKEHLLLCPACNAYYHDIVSMKASMASMSIETPSNIDVLISKAVRNSKKKAVIRRNIYRYSTVAAACLVVIVFLFSRGLFNLGSDKSLESAELQDIDSAVTDDKRGDEETYALTAENGTATEYAIKNSGDSANELVPRPEIDQAVEMFGSLSGYRYNTSAVESADTVVVNPDGIPLDSGYGGKQDVFYASGAYSIDEMLGIIAKEFKPDNIWSENENIFFYLSVKNLTKLETRLGLVASELVSDKKDMVSVRIISIKGEE